MRAGVMVLLLVLASGCTAGPPEPTRPESGSTIRAFDVRDVAVECSPPSVGALGVVRGVHACFEPSLAIDQAGRLFVTNARDGDIAVSDDEGRSWSTIAPPPPPDALHPRRGDVTLHIAPSSRLYWSAITFQSVVTPGLPALAGYTSGVEVAWSDDGGSTWTSTHLLGRTGSDEPLVLADRQWMAFAPDGATYLTFTSVDSAWTARSDDGGATWPTWARVGDGPPTVTATGTVLIGECPLTGSDILLHRSTDRGASYATHVLAQTGCFQWPVLAERDGLVVFAWWSGSDILVAASTDDGETWSAPTTWAQDAVIGAWPLLREDGVLDLVWHGPRSEPMVRLATGPATGAPTSDIAIGTKLDLSGRGRTTDYALAAHLPDGRLVTPYADPDVLRIVVEQK